MKWFFKALVVIIHDMCGMVWHGLVHVRTLNMRYMLELHQAGLNTTCDPPFHISVGPKLFRL